MSSFTSTSLPEAVSKLLRLNHYRVEGPVHVHGSEIDLVATSLTDPFAAKLYIEVTVEYVDTAKLGKDLTKLVMISKIDPTARTLIVSSTGFTVNVRERAEVANVMTRTYDELFKMFEKFEPYVDQFLGDGHVAKELQDLSERYQPPHFDDSHGRSPALEWLDGWLDKSSGSESWLIVVGEYGTGKTALTRMIQQRWLEAYKSDPERPIPLRIELGNFTRQFDAQGLLHHFLDHNGLSHLSIDFLWSLIRSGRVVLLLDGYDEMAQYLNQRERRECLKTLAELTSDGARGLLTSRPNYFSENEEFALFDHLYRGLELRSGYLEQEAENLRVREAQIDSFIERSLLDRYERSLQDLTPTQTQELVREILRDQPKVADTVLSILDRVFRSTEEGASLALSGKPVIISYLVEVATSLQEDSTKEVEALGYMSEWEVYTLVLDKLALRDLEQVGLVSVPDRRRFLQELALWLTRTGSTYCGENEFRALVAETFAYTLRRNQSGQRASEAEQLFEDLRRSGSLSRDTARSRGWRFSHNSLREFLVAERLLDDLKMKRPLVTSVPISDAMRAFVASRKATDIAELRDALTDSWASRHADEQPGAYFTLLFDALNKNQRPTSEPSWHALKEIAGDQPAANSAQLSFVALSTEKNPAYLESANFSSAELSRVSFDFANLRNALFNQALLDGVTFRSADLADASFKEALLFEVSFSDTDLSGVNFLGVDESISLLVDDPSGEGARQLLSGNQALGYLRHMGAHTADLDPILVWVNHPKFAIVEKIASKLLEDSQRQRRGLVQRGVAAIDTRFARRFVDFLERERFVRSPGGRSEIVEVTQTGRNALGPVATRTGLDKRLVAFLEAELG